ncbi:MAG: hypothetical protein ACLFTI_06220 [Anaerolineales bacterium]
MISPALIQTILDQYALAIDGVHGVTHWARVLENGLRLAARTHANVAVVQLFAIFHDAKRRNEGMDHGHGQRGADYAAELRGALFTLSDHEFSLLYTACTHHTAGFTEGDVTVRTCWDADRLDLGRVGIEPAAPYLCTEAARDAEILAWANRRSRARVTPELVWAEWEIDL